MQNMPHGPASDQAKNTPTKNRFSIEDSAAFRKANHDAMEAVKISVAKLKAERERFFREAGKGRDQAETTQASPVAIATNRWGPDGEGLS